MLNIQQRMRRAAAVSEAAAARKAARAATQVTVAKVLVASAETPPTTGPRGKAWAQRRSPYPATWTLRFLEKDRQRPDPVRHALKRSLFYIDRVPSQVLAVGSMVAVARKPAPRGQELEWFEYVATDAADFRLFHYRLKKGHAFRGPKSFQMKLVQTYRTNGNGEPITGEDA